MRTLVLGGVRSGKSAFAESLLSGEKVRYLATARPQAEDDEFAQRIAEHKARRPAGWLVVDRADPVPILRDQACAMPTLLDDVGGWLTAQLDTDDRWSQPCEAIGADIDAFVGAVADYSRELVIVSAEVGWGVIPATRAGRRFADELGGINQRLAAVCDTAYLVVAGMPVRLKQR